MNIKKQEQAISAWQTAQQVLSGKKLEDLVSLHTEGPFTNATVASSSSSVKLCDFLRNWSCCSCKRATQQQLCYHHVLALLARFPQVTNKTFSDTLIRWAGRKFGADTFCHRGLGGMKALTDKLQEHASAAETAKATVRSSMPRQVAHVQIAAPADKLYQAQQLLAQHPLQVGQELLKDSLPDPHVSLGQIGRGCGAMPAAVAAVGEPVCGVARTQQLQPNVQPLEHAVDSAVGNREKTPQVGPLQLPARY